MKTVEINKDCIPGADLFGPVLVDLYRESPEDYCQRLRNYMIARALIYSQDTGTSLEASLIVDADAIHCQSMTAAKFTPESMLFFLFKDPENFLVLINRAATFLHWSTYVTDNNALQNRL
jgi:hypothetical protein